MSFQRALLCAILLLLIAPIALAQDSTTSGVKGKVKVISGSPSGVSVVVRKGETEVARTTTDSKGSFRINGLTAGIYTLIFHKTGFSTGTLTNVELRAGKVKELGDRLVLSIDEGSLAFLRGSVFDQVGRSVVGARVDLMRVSADGTEKRIDGRLTNESGQFVFRLTPEAAKYRVRAKIDGAESVSKDVSIDGPAVYRIALSLKPASN